MHMNFYRKMQESIFVNRGFQLVKSFHFNHQIKCIGQQSSDSVAVFYNVGSENVVSLCPLKQNEKHEKFSLKDGSVNGLIYSKKDRLFIVSGVDLTLRVYNEHFELLDMVHITATVLSMAFNEATSELYTCGVGCINTWMLRHQLHNPLVPGSPLQCAIQRDQWVMHLDYSSHSGQLMAVGQDAVYILDTQTRKQVYQFASTHRSSLTCAVLFDSMEYLITGAKDGSIKIWNCILRYEVHTFNGHTKAITGFQAHPNAPCVISCSLDGTIRTWHLENMTECSRVNCGESVLGMCSDYPSGNKLASYTHHTLKIWEVRQLETHFTTVNSHVVSMFRAVSSNPASPLTRIVAMAEDDGLRLLSPVSGQILTILFPMFSAQLLEDVVYILAEEQLFILLNIGMILVVSTATNPCLTLQLWTPSNRNNIHCITKITVLLEDGSTLPVVFGGQQSGDITLLHSPQSQLSMPTPCPSHDGPVIKLIGSCDPIDPSHDHHCALVSYGVNKMLNIWSLELNKTSLITLKMNLSINIEQTPSHMCLLGSRLCMAMDNTLIILDLTKYEDSYIIPTVLTFPELSLLLHEKEDDHTDSIISLTCSEELKLFATSSKDGFVKIWSRDNQLVSELEFGESLGAICFSNSRGDLLVGFHKHVCWIKAEDCLPTNYLSVDTGLLFDGREERPITFDPELEFWYDCDRVPNLPAEQKLRDKLINSTTTVLAMAATGPNNDEILQPVAEISEESLLPGEEKLNSTMHELQRMVDVRLAQSVSQQYSIVLKSSSDVRQSEVSVEHNTPTTLYQSEHLSQDSTQSVTMPISPQGSTRVLSHFIHPLAQGSNPLLQVMPLKAPSNKYPIAPDGMIPNSVVRLRMGNILPTGGIPTSYKPPKSGQSTASDTDPYYMDEDDSNANSLSSLEELSPLSSFLRKRRYAYNMEPWPVFRRRETELYEFDKRQRMYEFNKRQEKYKFDERQKIFGAHVPFGLLDKLLAPLPSIPGLTADHTRTDLTVKSRSPANIGLVKSQTLSIMINPDQNADQVQSMSSTSISHMVAKTSQGTMSKLDELGLLIRKIRGMSWFPNGDLKANDLLTMANDALTVANNASTGENDALTVINDPSTVANNPSAVANDPSTVANDALTVEQLFAELIPLVDSSDLSVFAEVCSALMDLNKLKALNEDQNMTFALRLAERLQGTEKSVSTNPLRMEILGTLEKLGLLNEEVLSVILPLLTDSNSEIRSAAFATLESVTGVVKRNQLHQLLVDLGVLRQSVKADEDEVIGELAKRVKNGEVQPPSKLPFFESRATKTQLTPISSDHTHTSWPPSFPTAHPSLGHTHLSLTQPTSVQLDSTLGQPRQEPELTQNGHFVGDLSHGRKARGSVTITDPVEKKGTSGEIIGSIHDQNRMPLDMYARRNTTVGPLNMHARRNTTAALLDVISRRKERVADTSSTRENDSEEKMEISREKISSHQDHIRLNMLARKKTVAGSVMITDPLEKKGVSRGIIGSSQDHTQFNILTHRKTVASNVMITDPLRERGESKEIICSPQDIYHTQFNVLTDRKTVAGSVMKEIIGPPHNRTQLTGLADRKTAAGTVMVTDQRRVSKENISSPQNRTQLNGLADMKTTAGSVMVTKLQKRGVSRGNIGSPQDCSLNMLICGKTVAGSVTTDPIEKRGVSRKIISSTQDRTLLNKRVQQLMAHSCSPKGHTSLGVQQLMTRPHLFSQCPEAIRFILESKVSPQRVPPIDAEMDYQWIDIHALIRRSLSRVTTLNTVNEAQERDFVSEYSCLAIANAMALRLIEQVNKKKKSLRKKDSQKKLVRKSSAQRKLVTALGRSPVTPLPKLTCS